MGHYSPSADANEALSAKGSRDRTCKQAIRVELPNGEVIFPECGCEMKGEKKHAPPAPAMPVLKKCSVCKEEFALQGVMWCSRACKSKVEEMLGEVV